MNPTAIPEAYGTTLTPDANPFVGHLAAYLVALAAVVAIGWALFLWRRRRGAGRDHIDMPRAT